MKSTNSYKRIKVSYSCGWPLDWDLVLIRRGAEREAVATFKALFVDSEIRPTLS